MSSTLSLFPAAIAKDRTPEWHALRSTGIGASESAATCGLSRWETALDVWSRKVQTDPPKKVETPVMALGTIMEKSLWIAWEKQTGIGVVESGPGLFRHPDLPHILASPDAILADGTNGESKVTTDANEDLGDDVDGLPYEWICQAFQQMAVLGTSAVRFAVLVVPQNIRQWMLDSAGPEITAAVLCEALDRGKADLRTYVVERHTAGIDKLLERETAFWNEHVLTRQMPPIDWEHARAVESIKRACLETQEGMVVPLDAEADALNAEWESAKAQIKELESTRDKLGAELMLRVGSAQAGVLPSGSLLKKIVVGEAVVPEYVRQSYAYLRKVKGPK